MFLQVNAQSQYAIVHNALIELISSQSVDMDGEEEGMEPCMTKNGHHLVTWKKEYLFYSSTRQFQNIMCVLFQIQMFCKKTVLQCKAREGRDGRENLLVASPLFSKTFHPSPKR